MKGKIKVMEVVCKDRSSVCDTGSALSFIALCMAIPHPMIMLCPTSIPFSPVYRFIELGTKMLYSTMYA